MVEHTDDPHPRNSLWYLPSKVRALGLPVTHVRAIGACVEEPVAPDQPRRSGQLGHEDGHERGGRRAHRGEGRVHGVPRPGRGQALDGQRRERARLTVS